MRYVCDRFDRSLGWTGEPDLSEACVDRLYAEGTNVTITGIPGLLSMTLNGVPVVWSEDYDALVACCPTKCDPDCELIEAKGCHEGHQATWKRSHDVITCEARQRDRLVTYNVLP